jgi:hypothetical protein
MIGAWLLGVAFSGTSLLVEAATMDVRAVFSPDPANPRDNQFKNVTPSTGYCAAAPGICRHDKIFSLQTPITFGSIGPIVGRHTDPRQGAMFKVPAEWRTITVTKVEGEGSVGESAQMKVRIAGIGTKYRLSDTATNLVGRPDFNQNLLWGGQGWLEPLPPCRKTSWVTYNDTEYTSFWITPVEGTCTKTAAYTIPGFDYIDFGFAYALETPEPLKLSQGVYIGSVTYQIGPGRDFDMGDIMVASDDTLTLNFTLDVQHTLKVEIPPGGNRVELVPQGGWQAWLQRNRRPERLFRDQTFNLSASSRFKMGLDCQYGDGGNTCMLYEPNSGHAVAVDIAVTLPSGMTDATGHPVNRRRLLRDGSGTELFLPGHYIDRKPGTLHFEIARPAVEEMLGHPDTTPAKTYAGNVTVIWDSET